MYSAKVLLVDKGDNVDGKLGISGEQQLQRYEQQRAPTSVMTT
ncbi:hypothetical protein [Paenibacillus phytorum]|nr:hypothetical protein [Paenibacillus phytorum]